MNIEQIIRLLDAGYTKEEITAMQGGGSAAQPAQPAPEAPAQPAEQPAQETQPEVKQAEPSAQPSSQGQKQDDAYARLEAKLNQLIGLQQAGAINQTIPGSAAAVKTPEQILGSVIAPPRKDRTK